MWSASCRVQSSACSARWMLYRCCGERPAEISTPQVLPHMQANKTNEEIHKKTPNTESLAQFLAGSETPGATPPSPCERSARRDSRWPLTPKGQRPRPRAQDGRTTSLLPASSRGPRAQPPGDTATGASSRGEKHPKERATNELIHGLSTWHANDVSTGTISSCGTHR